MYNKPVGRKEEGAAAVREAQARIDARESVPGTNVKTSTAEALEIVNNKPFPFGKYKGKTANEIYKIDRAYLDWFYRKVDIAENFISKKLYDSIPYSENNKPVHTSPSNDMVIPLDSYEQNPPVDLMDKWD